MAWSKSPPCGQYQQPEWWHRPEDREYFLVRAIHGFVTRRLLLLRNSANDGNDLPKVNRHLPAIIGIHFCRINLKRDKYETLNCSACLESVFEAPAPTHCQTMGFSSSQPVLRQEGCGKGHSIIHLARLLPEYSTPCLDRLASRVFLAPFFQDAISGRCRPPAI